LFAVETVAMPLAFLEDYVTITAHACDWLCAFEALLGVVAPEAV
jgi:hypothetical protein